MYDIGYAQQAAASIGVDLNPPPPTLELAPVPSRGETVGEAITPVALSASGGTPPYSYGVTGLPTGLSLSGATISGTPTTAGNYTTAVAVTDSGSPKQGATESVQFAVAASIAPPPPGKNHLYIGVFCPGGIGESAAMAESFGAVPAGTLMSVYGWGTTWAQSLRPAPLAAVP